MSRPFRALLLFFIGITGRCPVLVCFAPLGHTPQPKVWLLSVTHSKCLHDLARTLEACPLPMCAGRSTVPLWTPARDMGFPADGRIGGGCYTTLAGLIGVAFVFPRVARGAQPWALLRNTVGVGGAFRRLTDQRLMDEADRADLSAVGWLDRPLDPGWQAWADLA